MKLGGFVMSVSDNIALFNSKIDQTYWTERVINNHTIAILPDENYYKLLQKPYIKAFWWNKKGVFRALIEIHLIFIVLL